MRLVCVEHLRVHHFLKLLGLMFHVELMIAVLAVLTVDWHQLEARRTLLLATLPLFCAAAALTLLRLLLRH